MWETIIPFFENTAFDTLVSVDTLKIADDQFSSTHKSFFVVFLQKFWNFTVHSVREICQKNRCCQ